MSVVRSVLKAVRILETVGSSRGITVTELAETLELPKSSTHDILSTLEQEGLIGKDHELNRYHLGLRLFELGNLALEDLEIRRVATPYLRRLNSELDETVHLTVLEDDEVLYVECFESTKRLRTYSVIGVRAPLHCTAVGKAILAGLPETEADRIIKQHGLPRFTDSTITETSALRVELEKITQRGYSIDNIEHEEGVRCVGAAIRDHAGSAVGSISVSGPTQRIRMNDIGRFGGIVSGTANEISARLGFKPAVLAG